MSNSTWNFRNNRRRLIREQTNYWRYNLGSGLLRLVERILFKFNVSDVLGGNLGQIQHLSDVSKQIVDRKLVTPALMPNSANDPSSFNKSEATVPQYLVHLRDARVDVLTGLIFLDAGFIIDSTLAKWQKVVFRGGIGSAAKRAENAKDCITGHYMVFPHTPFYYHAVVDEMPNLLKIRREYPACNTVIVHKLSEKWTVDLLKVLNFEVIISKANTLKIENLLTITAPRALNRKNLELLRVAINPDPRKILIVSRSGTPRSDDSLEAALLEAITDAELIDPGALPIEDQIHIFSKAKVIIGLHGGALTNMVWMHETGKVVEIFNHAYRTSDYETLCRELGQGYLSIETSNTTTDAIIEQVLGFVND